MGTSCQSIEKDPIIRQVRQNTKSHRSAQITTIATSTNCRASGFVLGGLEAARITASRGHQVHLYEASDRLGGQLTLASKGMTRRQIWGAADWLVTEIDTLGVDINLNTYIEADDILPMTPDLVIVATGGWPDVPQIEGGNLTTSSWDVLSGEARISGDTLLMDEIGDHPAAVTADVLARAGSAVEIISPDRALLHNLGPTTSAVALRDLSQNGVTFTCLQELDSVRRDGNKLRATLRHVLTKETTERVIDHIVIEHGLTPMDTLYFDLKPHSKNLGQVDHQALIAGTNPFTERHSGQFHLARIGDAITSRNMHAALLDALRTCKTV